MKTQSLFISLLFKYSHIKHSLPSDFKKPFKLKNRLLDPYPQFSLLSAHLDGLL